MEGQFPVPAPKSTGSHRSLHPRSREQQSRGSLSLLIAVRSSTGASSAAMNLVNCLKEVCAHEEVLRADPGQDMLPKCGAVARSRLPPAPGVTRPQQDRCPELLCLSPFYPRQQWAGAAGAWPETSQAASLTAQSPPPVWGTSEDFV